GPGAADGRLALQPLRPRLLAQGGPGRDKLLALDRPAARHGGDGAGLLAVVVGQLLDRLDTVAAAVGGQRDEVLLADGQGRLLPLGPQVAAGRVVLLPGAAPWLPGPPPPRPLL